MAMYDWNGDGEKDFIDDMIDLDIDDDLLDTNDNGRPAPKKSRPEGKLSGLGIFLSFLGSIIIFAVIYIVLDVDISEANVVGLLVMWALCFCLSAYICMRFNL